MSSKSSLGEFFNLCDRINLLVFLNVNMPKKNSNIRRDKSTSIKQLLINRTIKLILIMCLHALLA